MPCDPVVPCGIVKLNVAALLLPEFITTAVVPGAPVTVLPTAIVAAAPLTPVAPCGPVAPVAPVGPVAPCTPVGPVVPCGIVKLKIAADVVPLLFTEAACPGPAVLVVPTLTVAAVPVAPVGPWIP